MICPKSITMSFRILLPHKSPTWHCTIIYCTLPLKVLQSPSQSQLDSEMLSIAPQNLPLALRIGENRSSYFVPLTESVFLLSPPESIQKYLLINSRVIWSVSWSENHLSCPDTLHKAQISYFIKIPMVKPWLESRDINSDPHGGTLAQNCSESTLSLRALQLPLESIAYNCPSEPYNRPLNEIAPWIRCLQLPLRTLQSPYRYFDSVTIAPRSCFRLIHYFLSK